MAVIKNNDLKAMSPKEAETKIAELESAILELHGEGKREKVKPLKKTIAKLRTVISNASKETKEKPAEQKQEKPKEEKPKEEKPKV